MARKYTYRVSGGCALCMTCIYQCPVGAITMIEDVSAKIDSLDDGDYSKYAIDQTPRNG